MAREIDLEQDNTLTDSLLEPEEAGQAEPVATEPGTRFGRVLGIGRIFRGNRALWVTAGIAVLCLVAGLLVGRFVMSPADIAANTNAPKPGYITVPVEYGELSNDVTLRGQVGYADATEVKLTASELAEAAVVTGHVPEVGDDLDAGAIALEIAGRPVFVLPGQLPSYRTLRFGMSGPDVKQLKKALSEIGIHAGGGDTFDQSLADGIRQLYSDAGYNTAVDKAAAQGVRDAREAVRNADKQVTDAKTALRLAQQGPTESTKRELDSMVAGAERSLREAERGVTAAQQEVTSAQLAVSDAQKEADAAQKAIAPAQQQVDAAQQAVTAAQKDLDAAQKALDAALNAVPKDEDEIAYRTGIRDEKQDKLDGKNQTLSDKKQALTDAQRNATAAARAVTDAEKGVSAAKRGVESAKDGVTSAQEQLKLAKIRRSEGLKPTDVTAARENLKAAEQAREDAGKQLTAAKRAALPFLPAAEVLYLTELPRRVDQVLVERGTVISGAVMSVSGATIELTGSAAAADAKLLHIGDEAFFDLPDGTQHRALISKIDTPAGATRSTISFVPDPLPTEVMQQIQGNNVRVQVPVGATEGEVLSVPFAALTAGPGGESRVEVVEGDPRDERATTRLVVVTTGLKANGYVEVTPTEGELKAGDLVVVGA